MDQENYDFLTEKLKYTGFEDKLNAALKKEINSDKEEFSLNLPMKIDGKEMQFDLHFKKSQVSDRYFFNKYDAKLFGEEGAEPKVHTFYQNQGVTAKESFNLLEGRGVQKSLVDSGNEPYKAWLQLDLSKKDSRNNFEVNQYHEKYGFDLEAKLKELPILELKDDTKKGWMLKSIQKGNQYPVTMEVKGKEEIMFVEASPKYKAVNVYDITFATVKVSDLKLKNDTLKENSQEMNEAKEQSKKKGLKEEKVEGGIIPKRPKTRKSVKV